MKNNGADYKFRQTPEDALRTPWSLHTKPKPNEEAEDDDTEQNFFKGEKIS